MAPLGLGSHPSGLAERARNLLQDERLGEVVDDGRTVAVGILHVRIARGPAGAHRETSGPP